MFISEMFLGARRIKLYLLPLDNGATMTSKHGENKNLVSFILINLINYIYNYYKHNMTI